MQERGIIIITDKALHEASIKAAEKLGDILPLPEECSHNYSEKFEKSIKRLAHRTKHPAIYKAAQLAACFLLVFCVGFGSVMAVSAEAREAVFSCIKETYESFYIYFSQESKSSSDYTDYILNWRPEGFYQTDVQDSPTGKNFIYSGSDDKIIVFSYINSSKDTILLAEGAEYIQHKKEINGNLADIYLSTNKDETNLIVWTDKKTGTLLYINGNVSEGELIKMAESVAKM